MRTFFGRAGLVGAAVIGSFSAPVPLSARTVINFGSDFAVNPAAANNGWSYLWNVNGPVNSPASYVPLVVDNGRYESAANGLYPDPSPTITGNFLALGRQALNPASPTDLAAYPPTASAPAVFLRPGPVVAGAERAVALRYTFTAQDVPIGGAPVVIPDYTFFVSTNSTAEGMSARVFDANFNELFHFSSTTPPPFFPGFRFDPSLQPPGQGAIPLGTYRPGDSVWFVIGADQVDAGPAGVVDEMRLDVTLQVLPEPAGLSVLAGAGLLLARRRRRA